MRNIVALKNIREYYEKHPDSKTSLTKWVSSAKKADWKTSLDVIKDYPSADSVKNNRVVFNIAHNKYKLVVEINYVLQYDYICFIGTHSEYNKTDAATVNLY